MAEALDAIAAAAEPVLEPLGVELYDIELAGTGSARVLRVSVDRDDGVDLDTITAVSQAVSRLLDSPGALAPSGSYTLEVSSPGLERRLRTPAHFHRVIGSEVSVKARVHGRVERRRGVVTSADEDGAVVDFGDGPERLAYDEIVQARTVFDWDRAAPAGATPGSGRRGRVRTAR